MNEPSKRILMFDQSPADLQGFFNWISSRDEYGGAQIDLSVMVQASFSDIINYALAWDDTMSGKDFWCDLYEKAKLIDRNKIGDEMETVFGDIRDCPEYKQFLTSLSPTEKFKFFPSHYTAEFKPESISSMKELLNGDI